jgi:RNA polymerase sigma-70 factor, ECF subfamily
MNVFLKQGKLSDCEPRCAAREVREHGLQHLDALYNFACWLVHDAEEAKDLVQETYAKALRYESQFRAGTNLKAWLFQILKHLFLNRRRQAIRGQSQPQETGRHHVLSRWETAPVQPPVASDIRMDVHRALRHLPEQFRMVILFFDVEELSHEEIAAIMGCSVGTVKSRLSRGRALLRRVLIAYTREHTTEQGNELSGCAGPS